MNRSSIGDGARAADQPCAPRLRPLFFGLSWLLSPEGPYLLALTSPPLPDFVGAPGFQAFYANTAPTVDLGAFYSHRQGLEAITRPTFLILSAPLTILWQDYTQVSQGNVVQELSDTLFIASRSADVSSGIFAANQTGAPKNGASAIEGGPRRFHRWML
jgi:hypothetical protein